MLWAGAFLGGIASGAAGFAFGIAASAIWLHAIAPIHATFLVVAGGLDDPGRHDLAAPPFARSRGGSGRSLLAGVLGVPVGVWLLVRTDIGMLKIALGMFPRGLRRLCAARAAAAACRAPDAAPTPRSASSAASWAVSAAIPASLPAIWTQLRGWPKDEARAFYQPFIVVVHVATIAALGTVALDRSGLVLLVLALPALALGTWVGWNLYGRLDEKRFRQALAMLLCCPALILIL